VAGLEQALGLEAPGEREGEWPMPHVVTLSDADWAEVRVILMDRDGEAALRFLKEKIVRPIEQSLSKALDVSKGHV
jgi:hypothetical protein